MADRRVVITGLGVVTPAGIGAAALWDGLLAGKGFVSKVSVFDPGGFDCRIGGELADFSARNFVPKDYRKAVKVMARDIEIAVAAADSAFRDAGLRTKGIAEGGAETPAKRLGCNIGAGLICTDLDELGMAVSTAVRDGKFDIRAWGEQGMNNLTPLWLLKYLPNMLACHVTIIHGCQGPSNTITCGDASSHLSIAEAARWIQRGAADAVIAGGAESKLNPMGMLRQGMLGRLCDTCNDRPQEACRPLDAGHRGTVIGEGGGLVVLESYEHAEARGARIYAEVVGRGAACDPGGIDVKRPTAGSLELAVRNALRDAGLDASAIGAIIAHGTGVSGEDACEGAAWAAALGDVAAKAPAMAITGAVGSLFAGAGGVSVAMAALALKNRLLPPTVNFSAPCDGCGLNLSAQGRTLDCQYIVSGAFGIGGQSAALILKRCD
jgi:3-oxoacyl-[acyl-carrier-protein] synthase II